ncbi:hypothetical protein F0L68_37495 [Solihabitans fulvus]|uniref:Carbohydrate ABC transporter substrate-binding protein, CUT1 family n=1 Tax=Solihabitans fulvus TaxID=1892852 RepID=A0A5B2WKW1_9PSEU|nr:ABC transporter substrate-binding protein [Solihabitans fulvus]KAA2251380.1 hypothetical protein F0L68_37495 [Solihabitans fulvus]
MVNSSPQGRPSKRARVLAAAATGVVALSLVACGSSSGGSGDGKSLTYWSMWKENEPQAQVLQAAADAFKKDTGTTVTIQWQGRDVLKKLTPTLRSGDVPDLVDQDENSVKAALVSTKAQRDLTGLYGTEVSGGKKVSDVISDKYTGTLKVDGKPYLVPYEVIGYGLWFDGAALPNVVSSPPKTWADFTGLLAQRKAGGASPLALDADIANYDGIWITGVLQNELGKDKLNEIAKDKTAKAWDDPKVRAGLAKVKDLVTGGYFIPGYDGGKWPAVQEKWAQGQADFLNMGSWAPSETGGKAKAGFQYHFAPLPKIAEQYVPVQSIGFAIPDKAKNASAAEKFVAYFMRDENLQKISSVAKNLTPNPKLTAPTELADLGKAAAELPVVRPLDGLDSDFPGYVEEAFYPAASDLLKGKTDVDGFIAAIIEKQANYWKKNG